MIFTSGCRGIQRSRTSWPTTRPSSRRTTARKTQKSSSNISSRRSASKQSIARSEINYSSTTTFVSYEVTYFRDNFQVPLAIMEISLQTWCARSTRSPGACPRVYKINLSTTTSSWPSPSPSAGLTTPVQEFSQPIS